MDVALERRIRERIRGFDVPSLLDVLNTSGYGDAEIEYRSHRTTLHQSHLVHDIQFIHQPHKRIIITVNMEIGMITPPVGTVLSVGAQVANRPIEGVIRRLNPFLVALVICMIVVIFTPGLSLWLPGVLGLLP